MSVVCSVWVVRSLIVCNRFEFLAFSSDVSHWRQKQELVGVSVRYEFRPLVDLQRLITFSLELFVHIIPHKPLLSD